MVYVNSKKYACESCIKGHRSSSCHHNDRPLFEIKKKGRPVSQCEKCREARQSRRIHAKCSCDAERSASTSAEPGSSSTAPSKKGKRFIPTVPSLPNGLKDALKSSGPVHEEGGESRRSVDVLLNPCHCKDVWNCKCRNQSTSTAQRPPPPSAVSSSVFNDGLSALAHVAACCSPAPPPRFFTDEDRQAAIAGAPERASMRASRSDCPHPHSRKATNTVNPDHTGSLQQMQSTSSQAGPSSYRPIRTSGLSIESGPSRSSLALPNRTAPTFPVAPIASTSTSLPSMMSKCGCGRNCVCVGCAQHAESHAPGSPTTGKSVPVHRGNCAHDCPTCVDHDGGVEMPGHKPQSTFLDQFYARAAALPSPPLAGRVRSTSLDPTNVIVYPPALLNASESERDRRGLAFGLVNIPKLECCGGKCSCPEGSCSCATECEGCCAEDEDDEGARSTRARLHRHVSPSTSFARMDGSASVAKRSCCS